MERPGILSISTNSAIPETIRNIDLGPIKFKIMAENKNGFNAEKLNIAEEEYRKFLTLILRGNKGEHTVPCEMVDNFWHFHILDTEKYEKDTKMIFGEFLHHFPYLGLEKDGEQLLQKSGEKTLERYRENFGEPPYIWTSTAHSFNNCRVG